MAEKMRPSNDMGNYLQGQINPASTSDIAAVTAGGDATARLIPLGSTGK
jgi:hypothetical protein